MSGVMDALAALPDTAQVMPADAAATSPYTIRRPLPTVEVHLPERPADAALFPDHPDPGFEADWSGTFLSAWSRGNLTSVKLALAQALAEGLT